MVNRKFYVDFRKRGVDGFHEVSESDFRDAMKSVSHKLESIRAIEEIIKKGGRHNGFYVEITKQKTKSTNNQISNKKMAKKKQTAQLSMKFDKWGTNSVKASKIYRQSKKKWGDIFDSEVRIEKKRKKRNKR